LHTNIAGLSHIYIPGPSPNIPYKYCRPSPYYPIYIS
jgi:hypothetical protein